MHSSPSMVKKSYMRELAVSGENDPER